MVARLPSQAWPRQRRPRSTATTSAARSGRRRCRRCRTGRAGPCPTRRTSSSSAAATPGSTRPASWPARRRPSRSLEAHTLGWGASTRNGGIVHRRLQVGPDARSSSATARRPAARSTARRSTSYALVKRLIADESIDCDFREVGYLELAYAPSHVGELEQRAREPRRGRRRGRRSSRATRIREEIGSDAYHGGLVVPGQRPRPPGPLLRGARGGRRPGRRRPPRGRPRARRSGARPTAGSWSRPSAARSWPATSSSPRTATRTASRPTLRRRVIPIGSYIIASEPLPEDLARELSPKGRAFFDTKNFLYYWHVSADRRMVFGGRASFLPTIDRPDRGDPPQGPARGPPAARRLPDRVRVGRQRRLHVRPDAARRADEGRRHLRGGLLRHGRRADDLPRHEGRGVAGRRRGAGADAAAHSRSCRRRTRAGRGSCRSPASGSGSRTASRPDHARPSRQTDKETTMTKPLAVQLYTFRDTTRPGGAGLGLDRADARGHRRDRLSSASRPSTSRAVTRSPRAGPSRRSGSRSRARTRWTKPATSRAFDRASAGDRGPRLDVGSIVSGGPFASTVEVDDARRPAERRGRGDRRATGWRSATTTTAPRCARSTASRVYRRLRDRLDPARRLPGRHLLGRGRRRAIRRRCIDELGDRVVSLHVKDGVTLPSAANAEPFVNVAVGHGVIDVASAVAAARATCRAIELAHRRVRPLRRVAASRPSARRYAYLATPRPGPWVRGA